MTTPTTNISEETARTSVYKTIAFVYIFLIKYRLCCLITNGMHHYRFIQVKSIRVFWIAKTIAHNSFHAPESWIFIGYLRLLSLFIVASCLWWTISSSLLYHCLWPYSNDLNISGCRKRVPEWLGLDTTCAWHVQTKKMYELLYTLIDISKLKWEWHHSAFTLPPKCVDAIQFGELHSMFAPILLLFLLWSPPNDIFFLQNTYFDRLFPVL